MRFCVKWSFKISVGPPTLEKSEARNAAKKFASRRPRGARSKREEITHTTGHRVRADEWSTPPRLRNSTSTSALPRPDGYWPRTSGRRTTDGRGCRVARARAASAHRGWFRPPPRNVRTLLGGSPPPPRKVRTLLGVRGWSDRGSLRTPRAVPRGTRTVHIVLPHSSI